MRAAISVNLRCSLCRCAVMLATLCCHVQARLPKGIEKIRPHIDNVDNVPLLVSLFTDCTPQSQSIITVEYFQQHVQLYTGWLKKVPQEKNCNFSATDQLFFSQNVTLFTEKSLHQLVKYSFTNPSFQDYIQKEDSFLQRTSQNDLELW